MSDDRCRYLVEIAERAFSKKYAWNQLAQDICEQFYPMRADYTTNLEYDDYAGWLSDGHPVRSRETLGNSIDAMLRQGEWFRVSTGDDDIDKRPANAAALKRMTSLMRRTVYDKRSNWDQASKEADMDWVSVGNPVLTVEEGPSRDFAVYRAWHPRDVAWLCDEFGKPDIVFRRFKETARNIRKRVDTGRWKGPLSPAVERASQYEPNKEFQILHILMPTDGLYGDSMAEMKRIRQPFLSIYIDMENKKYLSEMGKPVWNYVIPRMRRLGDKPWGFCPLTLDALADARMLQDMALVILEQGQKAVDPPVVGASSVFTRDYNAMAGGFTEVDLENGQKLGDAMQVLDTGQRINVGLELKADVRAAIAESLLLNRLMLPALRDMREVEVMVRTEEFRRAALPFFQPIESQYHEPVLSVTFDVLVNMRQITPEMIPREMQDSEVGYKFTSPLNEAAGRKLIDDYNVALQVVASGAQVDQTLATVMRVRQAAEEAIVATGHPEWLVPEGEERDEKANQAEAVAQLGQAAQIAREGAGVVADTANATMAAEAAGMV